eukprot:6135661-Alexandrium_andersonii.AAC.1
MVRRLARPCNKHPPPIVEHSAEPSLGRSNTDFSNSVSDPCRAIDCAWVQVRPCGRTSGESEGPMITRKPEGEQALRTGLLPSPPSESGCDSRGSWNFIATERKGMRQPWLLEPALERLSQRAGTDT